MTKPIGHIPQSGDVYVIQTAFEALSAVTYNVGDRITLIEPTNEAPFKFHSRISNWKVKCPHFEPPSDQAVWSGVWDMIEQGSIRWEGLGLDELPIGTKIPTTELNEEALAVLARWAETGKGTNLIPMEKHLAAILLDVASDKFSNQICSDFRLVEDGGVTAREDRRELVLAMERWNGDADELKRLEELDDDDEFLYTNDWYLMAYLAARLKGKA
jgi:hypothetical protein